MAILPEPLAQKVRCFSALIPDDDIYDDGSGEYGRENEPHITVLYGLHTENPEEVAGVFSYEEGPITAILGGMSVFHNEDFVVLKIEVQSSDLTRLNLELSKSLENSNKYSKYIPHVTVAYLKHREDDPYWYRKLFCNMFQGDMVTFYRLKYSSPNGSKDWIQLAQQEAKAARVAMSHFVSGRFMSELFQLTR